MVCVERQVSTTSDLLREPKRDWKIHEHDFFFTIQGGILKCLSVFALLKYYYEQMITRITY